MRRKPLEITSVEFPSSAKSASAEFFRTAFGWKATHDDESYTHLTGGGIDVGLQGDAHEQSDALLMILRVPDIDEARREIEAAGAEVTFGPFDIPGGRRLHFREPGGNEMAMWEAVQRPDPPTEQAAGTGGQTAEHHGSRMRTHA